MSATPQDHPQDLFSFEINGSPRDLTGYGFNKPHPKWPHGAKIALSFVLNFEEGAENCVVNGPAPDGCKFDSHSEGLLNENPTAPPTQGDRNLNIESMYEFGARSGFQRILNIFTKAGKKSGIDEYNNQSNRPMPLTVYCCSGALQHNPEIGSKMVEAGWELATHGHRWIEYSQVPYQIEKEHTQACVDTQEPIIGYPPIGFYIGRPSKVSRGICMRTTSNKAINGKFNGFLYENDAYNDDLPFWFRADQIVEKEQKELDIVDGELPSWARPLLVLPYTLELNDRKFVSNGAGYSSYQDFFNSFKGAMLQLLHEINEEETESGTGVPKMVSVGLHCRLSGHASRAYAIKQMLDWVIEFNSQYLRPEGIPADHVNHYYPIWICRRIEIARHWYNNFYPIDSKVSNPLSTLDVIPQDFDKYADEYKAKRVQQ